MAFLGTPSRTAFCAALVFSMTAQASPPSDAEEPDLPPTPAQPERAATTQPVVPPHLTLRESLVPGPGLDVRTIDWQLRGLREQRARKSLGGPVTFIALGAGTMLFGLALIGLESAERSQCDAGEDCRDGVTLMYGVVGLVSGGAFLLTGSLWLNKRLRVRGELDTQIEALEQRRNLLLPASVPEDDELGFSGPRLLGAHGYRGLRLTLEL